MDNQPTESMCDFCGKPGQPQYVLTARNVEAETSLTDFQFRLCSWCYHQVNLAILRVMQNGFAQEIAKLKQEVAELKI
ncbi:MAG: hypothetical protein U0350_48705 [Caldilineaceae bacterium]